MPIAFIALIFPITSTPTYAYNILSKPVPLHSTGRLEGEEVSFSTSALHGGEWSTSGPGRALAPGLQYFSSFIIYVTIFTRYGRYVPPNNSLHVSNE
jgi:hypothetical protein